MQKVRVVLGIPSYKGPSKNCFDQHYEFMHYLGRLQERSHWIQSAIPLERLPRLDQINDGAEMSVGDPAFEFFTATQTGNSLIGQARDIICSRALELGADYVFFWDDDMIFARSTFLRLWRNHKPVCAALAFTSRAPIAPVIYKFNFSRNFEQRFDKVDIDVVLDYPQEQLFKVDAVGSGVLLIHTNALRQISPTGPWFDGGQPTLGEDIAFCLSCRRAGVPVYVDSRVKTLHEPNEPSRWHDEQYYLEQKETTRRFYEERAKKLA